MWWPLKDFGGQETSKCSIFGRPFVKRFALCYRSVVLSVCLSVLSVLSVCLSVCDVGVLWPNGWTDQDETWHAGRPRPWPRCVRWGPISPSAKGAEPPPPKKISAHVYGVKTAGWIKMVFGVEVGLSPGEFVLYGDAAGSQKGGGALLNFKG